MHISSKLLLTSGAAVAFAISGFAQLAHAEQVFKSTGTNGEVIYSNVAPGSDSRSEVVEIAPEPDAADIEAAQLQLREASQQAADKPVEANEINNVRAEEEKAPEAPPLRPVNPFIGLAPFL